ncbi:MAG: hypothetical protein ACI8RZ_002173 [Myxococcota bacterium]|jgi:hypothetical protein
MYRYLSIVVLLVGCNPSYEDFADTFPTDACDWVEECTNADDPLPGETDDVYECDAEVLDAVDSLNEDENCEYDAEAAKLCLELLETAVCDDEAELINDCSDVFTGEDCDLDLSTLL